jgi:hypothetical protein
MSGTYEDLQAWQRAIDLVVEVYGCTRTSHERKLMASRIS